MFHQRILQFLVLHPLKLRMFAQLLGLGVLTLCPWAMSCCFSGLAQLWRKPPSTMVLLRHGEREDYMAQKVL